MRHRVLNVALALAASAPAPAMAQRAGGRPAGPSRAGSWEISVAPGGTYLDQQLIGQVKVTDPGASRIAYGGALRIGYNLGQMWNLSVGTLAGYTKPATVIQPFAALSWTPSIDWSASPFLTVGAGATNVTWRSFSATSRYGAHVGAGLRIMLSQRVALRLEAREQYEKFKNDTVFPNPVYNGTASVGLSWFLGGRRAGPVRVAVTPATLTLASLGQTQQLSASVLDARGRPVSGRAVEWTSSDTSVVTVSATGLVTASGAGTAMISAVSQGTSGRSRVMVAPVPASLAIAPPIATLAAIRQTQQLTVTAQDANQNPVANPPVSWSSSDTAVATVSTSGLATAIGNGRATITAAAGGGVAAVASLTVAQAPASVAVTPATATISTAGGSVQLAAQTLDANGTAVAGAAVTWTSDAPAVATVSATGLATAVGNGTARIAAAVQGVRGAATLTVALPVAAAPAPAPPVAAEAPPLPAVNATVVLRNVAFRPNSWRLPPAALPGLDALAAEIVALPGSRWEIGGFTSSMGNPAQNLRLSQRRALAVKNYLVRQGVPAASLVSVGYGPQNPIATNATVAGRRQNMRVEIKRLQ